MAVCPKADRPIVTKMLQNKIPLIYRYIEEGACFVTDACAKIERLCKGISVPKELTESMQPSNGAGLGIGIEKILQQSREAIDCINHVSYFCSDFQERYEKVEDATKRLKEIAKTIEMLSDDYAIKLNNLRCMLENVMDAVRKELTVLQAEDEQRYSLKENLRQATAELEASKQRNGWEYYKDAIEHAKRYLNMIPESMMGCKLCEEGETLKERRRNRKNEIHELYKALHNLNEQIRSREQEFGEDHEINLRMSILILEAKSVDLHNAVEFLDNLHSLSVYIGEHKVYADLPIVLCELHKMSKVEMDSFKSEGIYLNARWVTIEKACTDYKESSIEKNFSHA